MRAALAQESTAPLRSAERLRCSVPAARERFSPRQLAERTSSSIKKFYCKTVIFQIEAYSEAPSSD